MRFSGRGLRILRTCLALNKLTQLFHSANERDIAKSALQIALFDSQVFPHMQSRKRIQVRLLPSVLFDKPNFVTAKQIEIEQMCLVCCNDQLLALPGTGFDKELQERMGEQWVEAAIEFINYIHLATCMQTKQRGQIILDNVASS